MEDIKIVGHCSDPFRIRDITFFSVGVNAYIADILTLRKKRIRDYEYISI